MKITRAQTVRTAVGSAVVLAGALGLTWNMAQVHSKVSASEPAAVDSENPTAEETPVPAVSPVHVTVNGREVPMESDGVTATTVSGGGSINKSRIEVTKNGRQVTVTDDQPAPGRSVSSSDMNVSVHSSSNGGSSWGSTQVFGTSFSNSSNGASTGFTSTQIFSNDSTFTTNTP